MSESCWTSYLAALDLESRTRSADRPLPERRNRYKKQERLQKKKKKICSPNWNRDWQCSIASRIPIVFDRSRFKARRQSSKLPFVPSVFRLRDKSHFGQCYFPADKFNWVSPFKKLDTDHPLSIHGEQKHEFQPSGLLFSILSNGPQRSDLLNIDNYRNSPRVFAFAGQLELLPIS